MRNGAGVYGLRRALVLAGSETQVMSLWSVNDESRRDLMVGFYKRLQAGEGRAEALQNVQLEMLGVNRSQQSGAARGMKPGAKPATSDQSAATPVAKPPTSVQRFSHPYFWAPFIESGA